VRAKAPGYGHLSNISKVLILTRWSPHEADRAGIQLTPGIPTHAGRSTKRGGGGAPPAALQLLSGPHERGLDVVEVAQLQPRPKSSLNIERS